MPLVFVVAVAPLSVAPGGPPAMVPLTATLPCLPRAPPAGRGRRRSGARPPPARSAVPAPGLPVRPRPGALPVCVPAVGPSAQPLRAALPLALVATGAVGLTLPPPEATANVTAIPATGLFPASVTRRAGGVATAVPAVADCVVRLVADSFVAGPVLRAMVLDGGPVSVPLANPSV